MMIITLCGSARFEPWYHAWNELLSLSGHCVFGLASYPSMHKGEKDWYTPDEKKRLDAIHRGKITVSQAILVLNVFAYIGESTLSEIAHARAHGKEVYSLETWGEGRGIGIAHTQRIQAARDRVGVPREFGSPIDMVHGWFRGVLTRSPWDLLPDAGAYRSKLVTNYEKRIADVLGEGGWR